MDLEQMLVQSLVNLQLDKLRKPYKNLGFRDINSLAPKQPKQISCLGFNLSNFDIFFTKGVYSLSWYFKPVPHPEEAFCIIVFETIFQHLEAAFRMVTDEHSKLNTAIRRLEKALQDGAKDKLRNKKDKKKKAKNEDDDEDDDDEL